MQIKTRLKLNAYISLCLILLMIIFLLWSLREATRADQNEALTVEMRNIAFDRILLRDEYILNHGERARMQGDAKAKTLGALIQTARARFTNKEDQAVLMDVQKYFASTAAIFPQIIANREREKTVGGQGIYSAELERLLFNQLLLKAYALTDNINKLQESARKASMAAHGRTIVFLIIFIALVVMVIMVNSAVVNRILMRRIEVLREQTEIIGRGNLEHRMAIRGDDELWDLARASNEMVGKLQASHTSVENLQKEIAERKRVEEELARSNADLEQYAYIASHDLQEPLRMITSYIQLIERRHKERFDADDQLSMQYVVEGATRMQKLINDLLAYSRVGRTAPDLKPTSVRAVIDETVGNLKMMIEETGATITYDDLPVIMADGIKLTELFQNLLSNAITFHSDSTPQVHIGAELTDEGWRFSVRDNGIGIDMRHADRVFLMFQRLQKREDYPGTGIGLAIAKKIVELHGGRIWVESRPGEGTTFYFTLPIKGGSGHEKPQ